MTALDASQTCAHDERSQQGSVSSVNNGSVSGSGLSSLCEQQQRSEGQQRSEQQHEQQRS